MGSVPVHHQAEAGKISTELSSARGPRLSKMTSLLHAFRDVDGAAVEVADVEAALREREVVVRDAGGGQALARGSVVLLSITGPSSGAVARPVTLTWGQPDGEGEVVWIDVHSDADYREVIQVFDEHRLTGPPQPGQWSDMCLGSPVSSGEGSDSLRGLTVEAAVAYEDRARANARIVDRPGISILVGTGWILTCGRTGQLGHDLLLRPLASRLERQLSPVNPRDHRSRSRSPTPADVALALVEAVVDTHDATRRQLAAWLGVTEDALLAALADESSAPPRNQHVGESDIVSALGSLLAACGRSKRSLALVQSIRLESYDQSWFGGVAGTNSRRDPPEPVRRLDARLAQRISELTVVQDQVEKLLQLADLHFGSVRQRHNNRLDGVLRTVTAWILVPSLVAGVFGANLPLLNEESWISTATMFALMLGGAIGTYAWLRRQ